MHDKNDQVNRVLNMLRSQEWTGEPYNIQLEERLMKEFPGNNRQSAWRRHRTALLAVCVLAVSSAGFAAAGGVAGLKNWLIKVNVNGQVTEVQTDENGEANFTVDTADGPADVSVKTWQAGAGEKGARVVIKQEDSSGTKSEVAEELVHRTSFGEDLAAFPLEALVGAEPGASWSDGQGGTLELFLLPGNQPGEAWRMVLAQHPIGDLASARLIGALPAGVISADSPPQVQIDEDGMAVITAKNAEGQEVILKIKARSHADQVAADPIKVNTYLGEIEVDVKEAADEE